MAAVALVAWDAWEGAAVAFVRPEAFLRLLRAVSGVLRGRPDIVDGAVIARVGGAFLPVPEGFSNCVGLGPFCDRKSVFSDLDNLSS